MATESQRRAAARERQRLRRSKMTLSQRDRERTKNRRRLQAQRAAQQQCRDLVQRQQQFRSRRSRRGRRGLQDLNTMAHQRARATESQEERTLRLQQDAVTHQQARAQEAPGVRNSRLRNALVRFRASQEVLNSYQELLDAHHQHRRQTRQARVPATHGIARQDIRVQVSSNSVGSLSVVCEHCGALSFPLEATGYLCCRKGGITVAPIFTPCDFLKNLFLRQHQHSKNFLKHIRAFNTALAFASLGAHIQQPAGRGPYVFKVQGTVYHYQSSIFPPAGRNPSFAQLYYLDPEQAASERLEFDGRGQCNPEVMLQLSQYLHQVSPFAQVYRQMKLMVEQHQQQHGTQAPRVSFLLRQASDMDLRRYNLPSTAQVAVVFQSTDGSLRESRDIAVFPHHGSSYRIPESSPLIDGLLYPLFFPLGDNCWTYGMPNQRGGNLSIRDFYAYRFAIRGAERGFNPLHYGCNLFQQYAVDIYCRVEYNKLLYLKLHQQQLRTEMYQGLMDYIANQAPENAPAGQVVILPSTFTGSPRNMMQRFQDALALVSRHGRPDLFITFTCNPNWPEIQEALYPGQSASDRPDITARVFSLKVDTMLKEIEHGQIFGQVAGYTYSIEFQKRGLPHMHLLLIFDPASRVHTEPEIVDKVISAEIPAADVNQRLHDLVCQHMMHGPCGPGHPTAQCMQMHKLSGRLKCKKFFPKDFNELTVMAPNTYPTYKRRDTGIHTCCTRGVPLDNRWVVPYYPYLLQKYESHINVEVCSSITVVKYIYKYFFKGHDRAAVTIQSSQQNPQNHDEIQRFLDARYVAAPEAMWRLQGHSTSGSSHSVYRLAVHLPQQQRVVFVAGQEAQAIEAQQQTTLTAWFQLNTRDPEARIYHYLELPEHYVYNKANRAWTKRKRKTNVIGRMPILHLNQGEKWFLRLLLLHIKGATSFNDLKTFNGTIHPTFQAAARERGLLANDEEWIAAMEEGAHFVMPRQMRRLFVTILVFGGPADPLALLEQFKDHMSHGLRPLEHAHAVCLQLIQRLLEQFGHTMQDFGLPVAPVLFPNSTEQEEEEMQLEEQFTIPQLLSRLNTQQHEVVKQVLAAIDAGSGACFFMDGPGGTGKTFVYNTLIEILQLQGKSAIAVASTGIAATLLKNGSTAHSDFKIPLECTQDSCCNLSAQSKQARKIRLASLIIWDEASMIHKDVFDCVNRLLQDLHQSQQPFGGKIVLFGGDFRQILPVIQGAAVTASFDALITQSNLWAHFRVLQLTQNMRTGLGEQEFANWLLQVGSGSANILPKSDMKIHLGHLQNVTSLGGLIQRVFGNNLDLNDTTMASKAILCAHNEYAHEINERVLNLLPGQKESFFSADAQVEDEEDPGMLYPVEYLNSITPSGMPPHKLNIKIGATVMLLRNINVSQGLSNGTRLKITSMSKNLLSAKILIGPRAGEIVFLPRITLKSNSDPNIPCPFTRRQFPIRLSYSMTINKSQGQTFDAIGLMLRVPVFAHGQLYVALSRGRSMGSITLQMPVDSEGVTRNIVFPSAIV